MAVDFTEEQKQAIFDDEHNLLVSASAGSGKTTVMIERIIQLLLKYKKTKEPLSISDFLVVTFTKASASDMKQKLIKSLEELEQDEFVLKQIEKVATSDISNLHSFCSRLVLSYFYEVGVDPAAHIIDDIEATFLKNKALDRLFETKEKNGDENFFELFDMFQTKRSDAYLREIIKRFDDNLKENIDGEKWLSDSIDKCYNEDLLKNEAAKIINNSAANLIRDYRDEIEVLLKQSNDLGTEKLSDYLVDLSSMIGSIKHKNSYIANAKNVFDIKIKTAPKLSVDFAELEARAKALSARIKKSIDNLKDNFVSCEETVLIAGIKTSKAIVLKLYDLVVEFNQIYEKLKHQANGLDFHDLEHYALKILENDQIRETVRKKYRYVFVDEYQDINSIQEKIISSVSSQKNRFMVGDVKQSIYRFRFCDPDIFLEKFENYSKENEDSKLIQLNCNFRSDKKILKFVDRVFSGVMTDSFGDYDYEKNAKFVPGKKNLDEEKAANLCFINAPKLEKISYKPSGVYSVKNHENLPRIEQNKAEAEAALVAQKIKRIMADRSDINFEDFAVLVSSRNDSIDTFIQTLKGLDIPVAADTKYDLMKMSHIQEIVNFVKLSANRNDDFVLFKVLKSKLFGFVDNELAKIRLKNKSDRFFEVFYDYAINGDDDLLRNKVAKFLIMLNKFSEIAKLLNIKDFVMQIIDEFDLKLINLASENGKIISKDIDDFILSLPACDVFDYVLMYSDFSLIKENECGGNAVKVMTIHKSKGIEFKFVFLINLSNQFNFKSTYKNVLFNKNLGIGVDSFDIENRIQTGTVPISAIRLIEKRKLVEEQQRLLYVAMTRAVEKLYVICLDNEESLTGEFSKRPTAFIDWFLPIIKAQLDGDISDFLNFEYYNIEELNVLSEKEFKKLVLKKDDKSRNIAWFDYTHNATKNIPLKNSISKILTMSKDDNNYEDIKFMQDAISSADRGTLYHNILQKINFKDLKNIDSQLENIFSLLSKEELQMVDKEIIKKVLNLDVFKEISNDDIIFQEREFYAKMPAEMINKNAIDDEFIMQGIIDLVVVHKDEVWVLDYKTGKFSEEKMKNYSFQVETYANVCERAFGKKVTRKIICFVDEQKNIEF